MKFTTYLISVLLLLTACNTQRQVENYKLNEDKKPNIIFIMTDEHAKRAMSAYSTDLIRTPNLDQIAKDGIQFNNAFVTNSICGPSRAVFLTGKHSHKNGFMLNRNTFDGSQETYIN